MKKTLLVLLLSCLAAIVASAQQTPATAPKTTAPAARTLTPAEQRQKEKIDREVQRDRQIRAEWAQKQREYEAKQAEKERQRQAKKAEKERGQQERETPKPAATPPVSAPVAAPANQPSEPSTPPAAEPTRKQRREKAKKETVTEPAPVVPITPEITTPAPEPVSVTPKATKSERPKRVKKTDAERVDSVSTSSASAEPTMIRPKKEFLPKGHLFEPILLDPLEAQTYGSVLPLYYTEGKKYPGSIVPFAFGFAKPFYRRTTAPGHSEEWVLDLASFTQFEAFHDDKLNKARRQIMNNDYKISIIYNVRREAATWRFRVYHLSSHLGDDYIYRNQITAPSPNAVNYELLDVTYSRMVTNWRLYGGLGLVLRKSEERKPLSAQFGAFYKKPSEKAARLVGGVDVKFWQQTDFKPGIHGGIGFELGRTQNNLTFLLEGYSGFRPYSQFESQQTSWIGFGLYLNPF
ncbi:hypothetical protein GCM10027341_31250 [Spirosoma knui]